MDRGKTCGVYDPAIVILRHVRDRCMLTLFSRCAVRERAKKNMRKMAVENAKISQSSPDLLDYEEKLGRTSADSRCTVRCIDGATVLACH